MKRLLTLLLLSLVIAGVAAAQPQLELGKQHLKDKKYKEALTVFRNMVENNSRDVQAWLYISKAYLGLSKPDSAELAAARARQLDDEVLEVYTVLSQAQMDQKKYADAYVTIRKGLKIKKENLGFWMQLAAIQFVMDSVDQALVSFTRAREVNPNYAPAYEGMGDCYRKQGILPLAIGQYERSIEIDSVQPALLYKLAQSLLKERRYTDAARVYQRLVNSDPGNLTARRELGDLYYRARQWPNAARVYKELYAKNQQDKELAARYVECLFLSRQYKEIIPVAEPMYLADKKNTRLVRYLATAYAAEKKSEKTVEYYSLLEKIDTLKADDYRYWGYAYSDLKKDTSAAIMWEKSIELDTTQSSLYGNAGSIWMSKKNWSRAAELFRRRSIIDTSSTGAFINYSLCMMALERFDEATGSLEKVIKQNPNYPPAYVKLGQCYNLQNRYDDARKMFESALKVIDTAESKYRMDLLDLYKGIAIGQMLDKSIEPPKKWEVAVGSLLKALKYKDDDIQVNLLLAQAYQNWQNKKKAIEYYKRVLKLDPKNEQAKKGLDVLDPK